MFKDKMLPPIDFLLITGLCFPLGFCFCIIRFIDLNFSWDGRKIEIPKLNGKLTCIGASPSQSGRNERLTAYDFHNDILDVCGDIQFHRSCLLINIEYQMRLLLIVHKDPCFEGKFLIAISIGAR